MLSMRNPMDAIPLQARELRAKGGYQQQSAVATLAQEKMGVTPTSPYELADSPLITGGCPPVTTYFRCANAVTGAKNSWHMSLITMVIKHRI